MEDEKKSVDIDKEYIKDFSNYQKLRMVTNHDFSIDDFKKLLPKQRPAKIKKLTRELIRPELVRAYIEVEEAINLIIVFYYGDTKTKEINEKRDRMMFGFILPRLGIHTKLEMLGVITNIDKKHATFIRQLGDIRNIAAHYLYYDHNLKTPTYKGLDLYTVDGYRVFHKDVTECVTYLSSKLKDLYPIVREIYDLIEKTEQEVLDSQKK